MVVAVSRGTSIVAGVVGVVSGVHGLGQDAATEPHGLLNPVGDGVALGDQGFEAGEVTCGGDQGFQAALKIEGRQVNTADEKRACGALDVVVHVKCGQGAVIEADGLLNLSFSLLFIPVENQGLLGLPERLYRIGGAESQLKVAGGTGGSVQDFIIVLHDREFVGPGIIGVVDHMVDPVTFEVVVGDFRQFLHLEGEELLFLSVAWPCGNMGFTRLGGPFHRPGGFCELVKDDLVQNRGVFTGAGVFQEGIGPPHESAGTADPETTVGFGLGRESLPGKEEHSRQQKY